MTPNKLTEPEFLVYLPHLQAAFRQHLYRLFKESDWQVDPSVWSKDWGVHIQPAGSGASALKYLGAYVARTAINDARVVEVNDHSVTFRWKDRANHSRTETSTIPGVEFVERYLRHVHPRPARPQRQNPIHSGAHAGCRMISACQKFDSCQRQILCHFAAHPPFQPSKLLEIDSSPSQSRPGPVEDRVLQPR